MKKIAFTVLFFIVSFSVAEAQNSKAISTNAYKNDNLTENVTKALNTNTTKLKEEAKTQLVKFNSDIRIFLNRERNVENMKIIFPKMNKRKLS